jgi:hypothetical protein
MKAKNIRKVVYLNPQLKQVVNKYKYAFKSVSLIASKSNWHILYAYYKPSKPSEKEIEEFKKQVQAVKMKLEILKKKYRVANANLLRAVEEKLNNIVDEYKTYPFSDRKIFFNARLKFIQSLIPKCFSQ